MSMRDFVKNENIENVFHELVIQLLTDHKVNIPEKDYMSLVSAGCSKQYDQNLERFLSIAYERDPVMAEKMLDAMKADNKEIQLMFNMAVEVITMLTAYQAAFLILKEQLSEGTD